jgi:hypothetical protein
MMGPELASRLRELLASMAVHEQSVRSVNRAALLRAFEQEHGSAWNGEAAEHAASIIDWARQRGDISSQRGGRVVPLAARALVVPEQEGKATIRLLGTDIEWRIGSDARIERVPVDDDQGRFVGTEYLVRNTNIDPQELSDDLELPVLAVDELSRTLGSIDSLHEWMAAEPSEEIITTAWNGTLERFVPDAPGRWVTADFKPDEETLLRRAVDDYGKRFEYRVFIPPDEMKKVDNAQAGLWRMYLLARASRDDGKPSATITVNRFDRTVSVPPGIPLAYERWLHAFGWKPNYDFHDGERVYHVPLGDLDHIVRPFVEHLGLEQINAN